jgi:hypothetical protein
MDWNVHHIIKNLLEFICLKLARMTHLDTSNISYGQKKSLESNWQFGSQPLKVGNHPNFFMCRWRATYCWKFFNENYNFSSNLILIRGIHVKLWALKIVGVPVVGISGLPLGSLGTKWHFGAHAMARHKIYYKGEGGDFPQICVVVSFMNPSLPMARPNTKSALTLH